MPDSDESLFMDAWSKVRERGQGLPHPSDLVGKVFHLACDHGSHSAILIGTVTAIQHSDESGLELYVSSPEFWGGKLRSLVHDCDDRWYFRIVNEHHPRLQGKLSLFT